MCDTGSQSGRAAVVPRPQPAAAPAAPVPRDLAAARAGRRRAAAPQLPAARDTHQGNLPPSGATPLQSV